MKKNQKTLEEQGYQMTAIQDECFIGTEKSKEAIVVLIKYEKQGKKNVIVKYEAREFPNRDYLDKFITDTHIKVISEDKLKVPIINQAQHIISCL